MTKQDILVEISKQKETLHKKLNFLEESLKEKNIEIGCTRNTIAMLESILISAKNGDT